MSSRRALVGLVVLLACARKAEPPSGPRLLVTVSRDADAPMPDRLEVTWFGDGKSFSWTATGTLAYGRQLGQFEIQVDPGASARIVVARGWKGESVVAAAAKQTPIRTDGPTALDLSLHVGDIPDRDRDGVPDDFDDCPDERNPAQGTCVNPVVDAGPSDDAAPVAADGALPRDSAPAIDLPPAPDVVPPDLGPPGKLPLGAPCLASDQCDSGSCPDARGGRLCATPGMVAIAAGTFNRGCLPSDKMCAADEQPPAAITLKGFQIDQYEVTQADYQRCRNAGACPLPTGLDPIGHAKFPVGNLTWAMADAYCRWAGKRLPTEAEWEHAARGPSDWIYPWGDFAADCMHAQYRGCGPLAQIAVGQLAGTSGYGAEDMAGNIAEWVSDWYAAGYYATAPASDPGGPAGGTAHVLRGGGFDSTPPALRTGARAYSDKALPSSGVRCALSL